MEKAASSLDLFSLSLKTGEVDLRRRAEISMGADGSGSSFDSIHAPIRRMQFVAPWGNGYGTGCKFLYPASIRARIRSGTEATFRSA